MSDRLHVVPVVDANAEFLDGIEVVYVSTDRSQRNEHRATRVSSLDTSQLSHHFEDEVRYMDLASDRIGVTEKISHHVFTEHAYGSAVGIVRCVDETPPTAAGHDGVPERRIHTREANVQVLPAERGLDVPIGD